MMGRQYTHREPRAVIARLDPAIHGGRFTIAALIKSGHDAKGETEAP